MACGDDCVRVRFGGLEGPRHLIAMRWRRQCAALLAVATLAAELPGCAAVPAVPTPPEPESGALPPVTTSPPPAPVADPVADATARSFNDELFGSHPAGGDGAAEKRRKYYEELMQYRLDKHGDTPNGVPEDALEAEMQIMDEEP